MYCKKNHTQEDFEMLRDWLPPYKVLGLIAGALILLIIISCRFGGIEEDKEKAFFDRGEHKQYVKAAILSEAQVKNLLEEKIIGDFYVEGDKKHKYQLTDFMIWRCNVTRQSNEYFVWNEQAFGKDGDKNKYYLSNVNPNWGGDLLMKAKKNRGCQLREVNAK